jgi:linearmycin/streptolysin S transport system permease protein
MRSILAIAWKDALVRFSSRTELLFFIILPVIFTFIIGGGFGGNANADARVRLLVVNEANTAPARQLVETLAKSSTVRVDELTRAAADAEFAANRAPALLTIPSGFDTATLATGAELALQTQPNSLGAPVAERAVGTAVNVIGAAVTAARQSVTEAEGVKPFASASARQAYFDHALAEAQKLLNAAPNRMEVTYPATMPYRYNPAAQGSAGQLVTWVFIPLLGISALLAYERRQGTLRRLFTMPVTRAQLLLGTISGQVVTALVQMILLVGFGIFVMKLNWGHDLAGLAVMLVATGLCGAAMGTMLGAFVKSESQANGLSVMLGMVMALLGGCWYPQEIFPENVRAAVQFVPTTWAMRGLTDLVARGQGLEAVLPLAGVLMAFAAVFFAVGVARFRYE